ncbi:DinB family protein [Roseimaritima sediminicola]|uniref:DinB family protein n=1 Tax=Roseimaritima sediminicola TaxID=2662066 RepID=UPI00129838F9|nr:DinB family protein [Roseimaritima sediminicola]
MSPIANVIIDSANISMFYIERLLRGVSSDQFARLAPGADGRVHSNHPAFIVGHLGLYAPRILSDLGHSDPALEPSEELVRLFDKDAVCQDDPDGTIYPAMETITERFFSGYQAALEAVRQVEDAAYAVENPNEAMRERFTTMASMHNFYLGGHMMIHMGQLSAWRRMMGMPPA